MRVSYVDREQSYTYLLSYLRSIPASSPSISSAALQTIAAALRIPTIFSFDQLLKIPAVQAVKAHALFKLLHIFLVGDLKDFTVWKAANEPVLKEFGTSPDCIRDIDGSLILLSSCKAWKPINWKEKSGS
jgi:hypothetical protein